MAQKRERMNNVGGYCESGEGLGCCCNTSEIKQCKPVRAKGRKSWKRDHGRSLYPFPCPRQGGVYLNHSSRRVPNLDLVPYQSFLPRSVQPYSLSLKFNPIFMSCRKYKEKLFPALYSALKFQAIIAVLQSFLLLLPALSMLSLELSSHFPSN